MNWIHLADTFPPKPISISPLLCHILVRLFVLYIIHLIILARVKIHEVPHYAVFLSFLSLSLCLPCISQYLPRTLSLYVLYCI